MTKARDIASAAPAPSTVSATEIGYLDGVSSAIQTQIDGKSGTSHNHDSTYVAKSLVDAKGDLLVGSANDTVSRLAVASTAGYVLTVDSAEATGLKWATPSAGALTLITQASFNNPNVSVSNCFSTTYENYLILINAYVSGSASQGRPSYWRWLDSGGNELSGNQYCGINFGYGPASTATLRQVDSNFVAQWNLPDISNRSEYSNLFALNVYRNASSNGIGPAVTGTCFVPQDINQRNFVLGHYLDNASTGVYGFKFYNGTYNLVGNYRVYGYQKS